MYNALLHHRFGITHNNKLCTAYYTHLKNYIINWLIINLNSHNQTKMFITIFWIMYFNYFKTISWFNHEINYLANKTWVVYWIIHLFPIHTFPSLSLLCRSSNGSVHLPVSVKYRFRFFILYLKYYLVLLSVINLLKRHFHVLSLALNSLYLPSIELCQWNCSNKPKM